MTCLEDHPIAALLPLLEGDEFQALVASMQRHGFDPEHPIRLYEGKILDGRNRYRAALEAGVEPVLRAWDGDNPWAWVRKENLDRRQLDAGQRAVIGIKLVRGEEGWAEEQRARREEADRRRSETQKGRPRERGGSPDPRPSDTRSDGSPKVRERDVLAAKIGVSPTAVKRALELEQRAPEKFEEVGRGVVPLAKARAAVKHEAKAALAAELRARPLPPPTGPFGVLVVDPPWPYETRNEDPSHRGVTDYPTMSLQDIYRLPVDELADEDAILWLWVTNAFMRRAFDCLDRWGFEEKTILTWAKDRLGLGNWLRNVTEHCILATRGKPVVELGGHCTLLAAPRREHSRKPIEFWGLVESLCPDARRLEMFSREPRPGWIAWGAEAGKLGPAT